MTPFYIGSHLSVSKGFAAAAEEAGKIPFSFLRVTRAAAVQKRSMKKISQLVPR